jgi:hypothetical protein
MIRRATFDDAPAIMALIEAARALEIRRPLPIAEPALAASGDGDDRAAGPDRAAGQHRVRRRPRRKPVAFIAGMLDRVYQIGKKLSAKTCSSSTKAAASATRLSCSTAMSPGRARSAPCSKSSVVERHPAGSRARVAKLYERKGFAKSGEVFEIRTDAEALGRRHNVWRFQVHRQGL